MLRRRLLDEIARRRPSLFIGIDAPDFNLNIAARARAMGIKTVQYGSPSVWMWRRNRIKKIRRAVDEVWCLFSFETKSYEQSGVRARFVGHPAALKEPISPKAARRLLNLPENSQIIALLPGSRPAELRCHLPLLAKTMDLLRAANRVFVAAAVDENAAKLMREKLPMATIQIGDAPILLAAADAAIVKSGTVTLEAALAQTPTVIFYRSSWMARQVIRWKEFYLPFFGLPNILCGRFVAPELLNNEVSPQSLATAVLRLLENKTARREMCAAFGKIRPQLSVDGALLAALEMLS